MSDVRDALLFIDLDKGGEAPGPLFEEPRRRLDADPRLRAGWAQYQALRALGWECAPEPGEKLIKQAMLNSRRERVKGQLARAAGSDDLAREILLGRVKERRGLPGWLLGLALVAALGLGWLAFGRSFMEFQARPQAPEAAAPLAGPASVIGDEPLPFEFSAQTTPADAALAAPAAAEVSDKADDMRHEDQASRQARLLLRDHLRGQEAKNAEPPARARPETDEAARPARHGAPPKAVPMAMAPKLPAPTKVPTAKPTAVPAALSAAAPAAMAAALPTAAPARPTAVPTPKPAAEPTPKSAEAPTAKPAAEPTPEPAAEPAANAPAEPATAPAGAADAAGGADLKLSASSMAQGASLLITVSMPQRREIDLRLFDMKGKPVRKLAEGAYGPGEARFPFDANDDAGQALMPATYYLRVMTPWFSRVEPIEIR